MAKFNSYSAVWCFEGAGCLSERMREAAYGCRNKLHPPKIRSGDGVAKRPDQFRGIQIRGGKQRILFAEDNPLLREVTFEFLQKAVNEVLAAKDGLEALDLFGRNLSLVDLLQDAMAPGHSGSEACGGTNSSKPEMPVTFTTGYATVVSLSGAGLQAQPSILQKPHRNSPRARKLTKLVDQTKRQHFKSNSCGLAG